MPTISISGEKPRGALIPELSQISHGLSIDPGWVFSPDDVTLLVPYLAKKLADPAFQYPEIRVQDVFSNHPFTLVGYGSGLFFADRKRNKSGTSKPRRTTNNVTWHAIGKETSFVLTGGASATKLELRYKLTADDSYHRPGNWYMDELFFKEKEFVVKAVYRIFFKPRRGNAINGGPGDAVNDVVNQEQGPDNFENEEDAQVGDHGALYNADGNAGEIQVGDNAPGALYNADGNAGEIQVGYNAPGALYNADGNAGEIQVVDNAPVMVVIEEDVEVGDLGALYNGNGSAGEFPVADHASGALHNTNWHAGEFQAGDPTPDILEDMELDTFDPVDIWDELLRSIGC